MRSGVRAGVETVVFLLDGNLCEVTLPSIPRTPAIRPYPRESETASQEGECS